MTIRRWEAAGTFPKRIKVSSRGGDYGAVAWDADEVDEFIAERRAARDKPA
jgi:predicted DNA-binding transcriptional regulator AlpA